nr:RagB/SusD family nutrient uptake outer membrane protein [Prevotella sp.]
MKKIKYLLSAATIILGFTSCSLDADDLTEATADKFPASEKDATASLAAIYENLNQVSATPQESFLYVSMLASDDNFGGGGTNDKLMQAEDMITNYNQNMTEQFYKDRYAGIARANTLIAALPNIASLSDEVKAQDMGEALTLRAFYHYELASMYGNVPLMTSADKNTITQGDVKVLWGQILQDFYTAVTTMPSKKLTDGHIDKYTAEGLFARAWLFYTGMYCNGTTIEDMTSTKYSPLTSVELPNGITLTKDSVIKYVDDCVDHSKYSLVPDYRNLWAYTNKYTVKDYSYTKDENLKWVEDDNSVNPESMFAIKFNKLASWNTTIGYANGYAIHFGVRGGQDYANTFPFGQGWGAGPVAPNLVTEWNNDEPGDLRLEASVQNVNKLPKYKKGGWSDFVQETDYYEKKIAPISAINPETESYVCCFEDLMYGSTGGLSGGYGNNMQLDNIHDLVLLRFADVLLMQSELKEDVSGINIVRGRVGLSKLTSYSLTALQNERRHELAFEGVRWNDIRRWHIAADALAKQENQPIYYCGKEATNEPHNGGYAARYKATAGFFKMPENQVSMGSVVQNEGWDNSSEYQGW